MDDLILPNNDSLATTADFISIMDSVSLKSNERRRKRTNAKQVKVRAGKDGATYKYIKVGSVYRWLDKYFPLWSAEVLPESYKEMGGYLSIAVRLTVIDPTTLKERVVTRYGSKEAILKKDTKELTIMPYLKSAETDAIKRCCVALGGFNDVYSEPDDMEQELVDEDRRWYVEVALPQIMKLPVFKNSPERLFQQILAFDSGLLSKDKIMTILKPME